MNQIEKLIAITSPYISQILLPMLTLQLQSSKHHLTPPARGLSLESDVCRRRILTLKSVPALLELKWLIMAVYL